MSKRLLSIFIAFMLILTLCAGCSKTEKKPEEEPAQTQTQEQIVMKIGHAQPVTHPRHQGFLKFKEMVEERTNNAIKVEIYPAGQLGNDVEMLDQVKLGTLQGYKGGNFEGIAPELLVYTLPFLFDSGDVDSFQKVTMGPIGDKIAKYAEKNGLVILATGDSGGFYSITNNKHPITKPDDMKGLKMRVPAIATKAKTMEAFGASTVTIPYGDVYMALKTGVADGQDNPPVNIEAMKFDEVQKYLTLLDYQWCPDAFTVNLKWYQSLSPEYQKILKDCAVESTKYTDQLVKEANMKALEHLKNSMQVTTLTPEQKQAFIDKVQPVYDYFVKMGAFTQQDIDEIREAVKQ